MRVTSRNHAFFLTCALLFSGAQALAQNRSDDRPRPPESGPGPGQGDSPHGPPHRPPQAAFTACADLKQDDVCEVQLKERTIEGKCVPAADEEDALVCLPDDYQSPPRNALHAKDAN